MKVARGHRTDRYYLGTKGKSISLQVTQLNKVMGEYERYNQRTQKPRCLDKHTLRRVLKSKKLPT